VDPGVAWGAAAALLGGTLYGLCQPLRSTAHGSAGWGELRQERDLLLPAGRPLPCGKLFLSEAGRHQVALPLRQAQQHTVIVGGSGTGKSRGYFLPNAALAQGISLVCTDPKGELWRHTSGFHPRAGRFAPAEPDQSAPFNWVPLCREAATAELCARAIVESGNTAHTEQAWLDIESAFLAALFAHAATLPEPTPLSAYRLFTRQPQDVLLQQLLASSSEVAQEQAMVFQQTQERMRGSIVPVVAGKLQFMRDPNVQRFTSASREPPDFRELRRTPQALYWCLREHDIVRLRPLTSLFFTLLLEQVAAEPAVAEPAAAESIAAPEAGAAAVPVLMLLDEFANVGVIPNFETTIALARGRGVSVVLGIQSLSQLEARYGKANAQTILTNCATKIALSGLDVETAEYVSRALGQGTVVTRKSAWHRRGTWPLPSGSTASVAEHARPILTSDEVRRIPVDRAIVITGNRRPLLLPKSCYVAAPRPASVPSLGAARAVELAPAHVQGDLEPPPFPEELLN